MSSTPKPKSKSLNKIIGRNIRALRKANDLSQKRFAHAIGFPPASFSMVSRIELGKQTLSPYMLHEIAKFFKVSVDRLVREKSSV